MQVVWSEAALGHLEAATDHIAQHSPAAAYDLSASIIDRTRHLTDNPMLGRKGRVDGTREPVVAGTPYIVVYEISDRIDVLAVVHGARRWPESFDQP